MTEEALRLLWEAFGYDIPPRKQLVKEQIMKKTLAEVVLERLK